MVLTAALIHSVNSSKLAIGGIYKILEVTPEEEITGAEVR
jgi:hypothetical protein